ncbi:MAG: hypothetical protein ACRENP_27570 [Longimicrobiales bacterium]
MNYQIQVRAGTQLLGSIDAERDARRADRATRQTAAEQAPTIA